MNSPSLSGSVAMYTSSTLDFFAFLIISLIFFSAPLVQPQGGSGRTFFSDFHIDLEDPLLPFEGKSWTCPPHAWTIHPFPKYFFTVFALAPDSRIISFMFFTITKSISYHRPLYLVAEYNLYKLESV